MENDKTRVEMRNYDANLEIPDVTKSPEKSKQANQLQACFHLHKANAY
jgi:hypothetical protein